MQKKISIKINKISNFGSFTNLPNPISPANKESIGEQTKFEKEKNNINETNRIKNYTLSEYKEFVEKYYAEESHLDDLDMIHTIPNENDNSLKDNPTKLVKNNAFLGKINDNRPNTCSHLLRINQQLEFKRQQIFKNKYVRPYTTNLNNRQYLGKPKISYVTLEPIIRNEKIRKILKHEKIMAEIQLKRNLKIGIQNQLKKERSSNLKIDQSVKFLTVNNYKLEL